MTLNTLPGEDTAASPTAAQDDNLPDTSAGMDTANADAPQPGNDEDTGPSSMEEAIALALDGALTQQPEDTTPAPEGEGAKDAGAAEDKTADEKSASEDKGGKDPSAETDAPGAQEEPDKEDDLSDDEMGKLAPKVQRRIRSLLHQRRVARDEATGLRGDAEGYRNIRAFMTANRLEDRMVGDLLKVGAASMSDDPAQLRGALDQVEAHARMLRERLGLSVPNDLQQRIETGELSEEAARDLSLARQAQAAAEARAQEAQASVGRQAEQGRVAAVNGAVAEWTRQMQATDPDFGLKVNVMKRVAQGLVAERGLPKTPEQAVQFARDAHAEATQLLRSTAPRPGTRPTPTPGSHSASAGSVRRAPTSLADAIDGALGG